MDKHVRVYRIISAPGFNERLGGSVRSWRENQPYSKLAPSTGWSSSKDFKTAESLAILHFAKARYDFDLSRTEIWANVTREGEQVADHDHAWSVGKKHRNIISGVYYPQDSEAQISFQEIGLHVSPREGLLLLFHPELRHSVQPAHQERISIAFNAH